MRRAARIGLWILTVPAALALLGIAAVITLNTDGGRRLAERTIARLSDGHVALTGLAGRFPGDLRLGSLQLSDEQGRWLHAEGLVLRWSPSSLLYRRVTVQEVHLARLAIDRWPRPQAGSVPLRSLPRTVDITQLRIDRVELGAAMAGTAVALAIQASASLRSIDAAQVDLVARRLDGEGRYILKFKVGEGQVSAQLDVAEPDGNTLANLLQLPGLGALRATASVDGPRGAERLQLAATAGLLHVTAAGTLDWPHRGADLAVSVHSPAVALRPDLGWRRLDLDGHWRGGLATAEATLTVAVAQLRFAGMTVAALDAGLHGHAGRLQASATATGLRIAGADSELLAAAALQASADVDLRTAPLHFIYTLSHPLLQAHGELTLATPDRANIVLRLPALAPWARLAGLDLAGSATLRAQYVGSSVQGSIAADGTVDVLGGTGPVAAKFSLAGDATAGQPWNLRWRASIGDLAKLSAAMAGDASAEGTVRGLMPNLRADATLQANASFNGSTRGPLEATVSARGLPAAPTATAELRGTLDAAPVQLSLALGQDGAGTLHITVQRGDWKSAHIDGELAWPAAATARQLPRGHLQLTIGRLEDLRVLTGQELPGQLSATLGPEASNRHEMAVHLAVLNTRYRGYDADVRLDGHGTTRELTADLTANVHGLPLGDLQLAAAALADFARQRVTISALRAQYRGATLQLRQPAQVRYGAALIVDHLRLAQGPAQLDVDGQLLPALDVHASLRAVTPAVLRPLLAGTAGLEALPAEGRLSGEAALGGSMSDPQGTVQVQATGLRWHGGIAAGLPPLAISLDARLQPAQSATLTLRLSGGSGTELSADGKLSLARNATLALRVRGTADLSLANGILEPGGRRAGGQLTVDGRIDGTLATPAISGTATLRNGDLQDYTLGLHLAAIAATLEARGDLLTLAKFSAKAGSGTIDGSGTIGLLQPGLPVALHVSAHDAQPVSSHLLTARLDADLQLAGGWNAGLRLSGRAQVSRAEITIPGALPAAVATLDVRRPGARPALAPMAEHPLAIDVTVSAPRAVFVRGRGLDAEVGGELHWGGTRAAPQISGGFQLRNGRFNLAGKTLEFQSGSVSFSGHGVANQFDPTLDFIASNTSAGVTATLKVSGYADRPVLTLESSPELPQDEVLSRLLFGASVTQLSALQLAQMGAAVATLGGIGGGGGPLLSVQRSLGLDRLVVSGSGTEADGASAEAGRYVARRVYVGTKQSTAGGTQAQVEIDISSRLKLRTTIGSGTGSAQGTTATEQAGSTIALSYEFEF